MLRVNQLIGFGAARGPLVSVLVDRTLGTVLGNMVEGGGLAAAFDGTTSQAHTAAAKVTGAAAGEDHTVGKDWGAGVARTIDHITVYGSNGTASVWFSNGGATVNGFLDGSSDGAAWTELYTAAIPNASSSAGPWDITSGITTTTAYRYHRFRMVDSYGGGAYSNAVAEVQFYQLI